MKKDDFIPTFKNGAEVARRAALASALKRWDKQKADEKRARQSNAGAALGDAVTKAIASSLGLSGLD